MRNKRILDVKLRQRTNTIYLLYLAKCYHGKEFDVEIYEKAKDYIGDYFEVYVNGVRSGCIYSTIVNGECYLDAYKDPAVKNPIKASILAYEEFILYISKKYDIIYTVNCGNSLLFNFVTKKLNFTFVKDISTSHKLYKKELHGYRDSNNHSSSDRSSGDSDVSRSISCEPETGRKETEEHSGRCPEQSRPDSQRDQRSSSKSGTRRKRRSKKKTSSTNTDDLDNPFGS